ncbi:hypothetical protein ACFYUY_05090 [Kitasatospora sp. NPDC004745]|uniref:hypothetical protein n=1 Tax=unclassified Kitasatospora TaxID=2633591 RepID=UPI003690AC27
MIQIRVICDVNDVPTAVADLCRLWRVHDVKELPARDSGHRRLYVTATRRATSTR